MSGPALSTEQVQCVPAVVERQRERSVGPRLLCRTPQYLDEPNTLGVVGEPTSAYPEVAPGPENPVAPQLDQPATDSQVCFAGGVAGQADSSRLGHPVVAEAVSGGVTYRVCGSPARAV